MMYLVCENCRQASIPEQADGWLVLGRFHRQPPPSRTVSEIFGFSQSEQPPQIPTGLDRGFTFCTENCLAMWCEAGMVPFAERAKS